jgi:uncharacterized protein (TIGR03083 family)
VRPEEYVGLLRSDGEALARAADGSLDRPVPSCPGWTVADLVTHTGQVHRARGIAVVRQADPTRRPAEDPTLPPRGALLSWYREGLAEMVEVLAAADPEQPAWSWAGDNRVGFWQRRMAHETAVHRWDAEAAVDAPFPIAPTAFAADGVAEVLDVHVASQVEDVPYDGPAGTVHVHATDADGEWIVQVAPGSYHVRQGHEHGDVALRGPASDLDLVLWKRLPPGTVEVYGDAGLLDAFLAWIDHD